MKVTCGAPKGSILGPALFILTVKNILVVDSIVLREAYVFSFA